MNANEYRMATVEIQDYTFSVSGLHRWAALLYVVFVGYPRIAIRFVRRERLECLFYLLFTPLWVPRNFLSGLISIFPLLGTMDYHLRLEEGSFSFGYPGAEMANSYSVVQGIFQLRGREFALLHDGWLVFLPPGEVTVTDRMHQGLALRE